MRTCGCGSGHLVWAKGMCRNCYNRGWRKENPEACNIADRRRNLRRKYKMTESDYETMLAQQQSLCLGCGKPPAEGERLVVDHDHVTDKVRGLLCRWCNIALGGAKDSVHVLRGLIEYLENWRK
jgi:hypothetical protein